MAEGVTIYSDGMPSPRSLISPVLLAVGLGGFSLVACSSDPQAAPSTDTVASTTSMVADSTTTSSSAGTTSTTVVAVESMRGKRYCEVLLVGPGATGAEADVYSTWTLNECPAEQWNAIDMAVVAAEQGALIALANGPRYWSMDSVTKAPMSEQVFATFGEIEMLRLATVSLGPVADLGKPYLPRAVDRETVFTYAAGSTVHELTAPDGSVYVMQSWSQQVEPTLDEAALVDLTPRLTLPEGWTYSTRVLTTELRVETMDQAAMVLQDDLRNSYSLVPTP